MHYYELKPTLYLDIISFNLMSLFCSWTESTLHLLSCLLPLPLMVKFLQLALFLVILLVLRSAGLIVWKMSLSWDVSDVFLFVRLEVVVLGRNTTEAKCCFHHITSGTRDLLPSMLTLIS